MAYGRGSPKTDLKRIADHGQTQMTPELAELRRLCLLTVQGMARAVWPEAITDPRLSWRELDRVLLPTQSGAAKRGLNVVWTEKMRLLAKPAGAEQWKRAQARLFGRFKHVHASAETPARDGTVVVDLSGHSAGPSMGRKRQSPRSLSFSVTIS